MPQVAEIKETDGQIWVRVDLRSDEGMVTLWTATELKDYKLACVRDFLIDIYSQWRDRL